MPVSGELTDINPVNIFFRLHKTALHFEPNIHPPPLCCVIVQQ